MVKARRMIEYNSMRIKINTNEVKKRKEYYKEINQRRKILNWIKSDEQ